MSLKELLLSRKKGFSFYILGTFLTIASTLVIDVVFALLIGLIEDFDRLPIVLLMVTGLIVFSIATQLISRFLRIGFMRDILMDIRLKAFDKIMHQSYQQFAKQSKDVYLSNLVNDINLFEQDFFVSLLNVIVNFGVFGVAVTILFFIDPLVAILTICVSIVMIVVTRFFEKPSTSLKQQVSSANESFSVYSSNTLSGLEILKLNHVEEKFFDSFKLKVKMVEDLKQRFNLLTETQRMTLETIGNAFSVGITILISIRLASGQTLTSVMFVLQVVNHIVWHLVFTFPLINKINASQSIYDKITKPLETDKTQVGTNDFVLNHHIKVENVSFAYHDDLSREILKDVNLSLEKGKKYLLKGASGAGKTTFLQLLSKVYEPTQGEISLDGLNMNELSPTTFNKNVAFIYQSVFLFNDTIRNNITLFQDLDEAKINKAVNQAGLREFIDSLPQGLDTMLQENGKNISGGQRQRISIARALIKDAQILFVDEATSSLDQALGQAIEQTLLGLDQMVIAISHRFYPGISEQYDGVISINNQQAHFYNTQEYFELGGIN